MVQSQKYYDSINCNYCYHEIDPTEPGYMYLMLGIGRVYYHSECFEFAEGVPIA